MHSYNVFWTSELNCGEVGLLYLTFCMRYGTALAYPLDENEVPCATSTPHPDRYFLLNAFVRSFKIYPDRTYCLSVV
jgi:hypothetical protein